MEAAARRRNNGSSRNTSEVTSFEVAQSSDDDQGAQVDEAVNMSWLLGFHKEQKEKRYRVYHTDTISPQVTAALTMFGCACTAADIERVGAAKFRKSQPL